METSSVCWVTKPRMCTFRFVASLGFRFRTQRRVSSWRKRHVSLGRTMLLVDRYSARTKRWIRRYIVCQAAKTTRRAPRWPLISLPLPSSPGEMVSFDILGPSPKTKTGNKCILLIIDLFSRQAEPYRLSAEEKTTK